MLRTWNCLSRTKRTIARATILVSLLVGLTLHLALSVAAADRPLKIVAFGDSLMAGFGLPASDAFPAQLESALRARGHHVQLLNAGVSGDTTTGGLARLDWAVPSRIDAVILELGANDALRGISPTVTRRNLEQILSKLKSRDIPVLIAGMRAPANWGADYVRVFDGMFGELAEKYNTLLYPFFLEGVIERADRKLTDALHPNAAGVGEIVKRIMPKVEHLIAQAKARHKASTKF
ncbi:MAG: arylesterase [Hyphomicrobiaceae bacterium]